MSVLARVVGAASPELRRLARSEPGDDRFDPRSLGDDRAFVLEAVLEGYLMHYDEPRAFAVHDADLRLLAGDALYAVGLSRLAETGDLEGVSELADLISLSAQAHAEGRPELVDDLWAASARALSHVGGPGARTVAAASLACQGPSR